MATLSTDEIARRLKAAREAQGMDREALARAAGVSRSVVVRELEEGIERQRNPLTLVRLARALGQPWDWLGAAPPATIPDGPGRRLYMARLQGGWEVEDLAAAAQVATSTIRNLEYGKFQGHPRTWAAL